MAKGQTGQATKLSNQLYGNASSQTAPVISGLQSQNQEATKAQQSALGSATSGYTQQQQTGGYDPSQLLGLRSQTQGLATTGGYDPGQVNSLLNNYQSTIGSFQGIADTYADPYAGYKDFAQTGGYTPVQKQQFINQATSGVPATYNVLEEQANLNRQRTGGVSSGDEITQLARQLSQDQANATLNAQTSIDSAINQNKLAGLGGEVSTLAGRTGSEQALLGAQQAQANLASDQASKRAAGTAQGIGLESGIAQGIQGANKGFADLYNTATGQITSTGQQILGALGLQFGSQAEAISFLTNLSKNPGLLQTIVGDVTGLVGATKK